MKRHFVAFLLTAPLVIGCETVGSVVDPGVAALGEMQALASAGDYVALADRTLDCRIGQAGCARAYEMAGDACLRLAQEAVASGSAGATAQRAACAEERFRAVLDVGEGDASSLGLRELEAMRLVRESAASTARAAEANATLAARAEAYGQANPGRAGGPYYGASAIAWRVAFTPPADPCPDLARASRLAAEAAAAPRQADPIDLAGPAATLEARLAVTASRAGCRA